MSMSGRNVKVFQSGVPRGTFTDNHKIAHARVNLKLAALAYTASTHDPGGAVMVAGALGMLSTAAIRYVAALENRDPIPPSWVDENIGIDAPSTNVRDNRITTGRVQLRLSALTYAQTRHGGDGGIGFSRAGMGMLCQAAVRYVEAMDGGDKSHLINLALRSDGTEDCR